MTRSKSINRSDTIFKVLNTIFSALLLIGLVIAYKSLKDNRKLIETTQQQLSADHDQRRRLYTVQLYDTWREVFNPNTRNTYEMIRFHKITEQDLVLIARGEATSGFKGEQVYQLRGDIIRILNFFEQIAIAYRDGVADKDMITRYFKPPIVKSRQRLTYLVNEWVKNENGGGWPALDQVIQEDWKEVIDKKPPLPGQ